MVSRLLQLAIDTGHVHTVSRSPLIIALIVGVLLSIPVVAILFSFAKKKKRIVWYAVTAVLSEVFFSIGVATSRLYWLVPALTCGITASIIVIVTVFQAGHESRVKARLALQSRQSKEDAEI